MKKMIIFEPAMCCSTGVCGPSVDPELLRISTVINNLKNNGVLVERYNLSSNPQIFVDNAEINRMLNNNGIEILPITMVDGNVVKIKAYLTDEEFCKQLEVSEKYLKGTVTKISKGCGSNSGCCS
ncbi:MAG: transcriptional regulator [Clostridiales bacterium GWB2_37_7]|nr:MAG: transcriptional regulator [Clostridiales bacterium GWB2_37_7]